MSMSSRLAALRAPLEQYSEQAPAEIGIAVAPVRDGPTVAVGELRSGRASSVMKVPLIVAFLNWRREAREAADGASLLRHHERRFAEAAITRSSNVAARRLHTLMAISLGAAGARHEVEKTLRAARDTRTTLPSRVNSATGLVEIGTTTWRLTDALGFFRQLARGSLLPPSDTAYVMALLRDIDEKDRWGVADAFPPDTALAFKGGWGRQADQRWLVEQVAVVGGDESAYVLAVMAKPSFRVASGADLRPFYAGQRLVREAAAAVAEWMGPLA
jgi:hypothetical protein